MEQIEPLLTKQETAAALRISLRTLDRWREEGRLIPAVIGEGSIRYRRRDVEAFIDSRKAAS